MANKNQSAVYPSKIRQKWYFLVEKAGKTVGEVCEIYMISRKTYYKWRRKDLGTKIHIPKKEHPKTKIKNEIKICISEEKLRLNYGPMKMKLLVKRKFGVEISTTSIYQFYKKKGLIRRPQKKLPWYKPLKDPVIPKKPGDVVQMDAKYIWEDNQRKYQRTFVDIYTGFQCATVTSTEETKTMKLVLDSIKEEGKDLSKYNVKVEENFKIFSPVGCDKCNKTGYKGRIGIFEAIKTDEAIENIIPQNPSEHEIKKTARDQGTLTMRQDGVVKILTGVTSLTEVQSVVDLNEE